MAKKLLDLIGPLEDLEFPNGRELSVRRMDGPATDLQIAAEADRTDESWMNLLRYLVPDATDDDWKSLGGNPRFGVLIVAHARQAIDEVATHLKNVEAGAVVAAATADRPRPSSPPTKSITSSRGSRGRSGKTGSLSTASRTP